MPSAGTLVAVAGIVFAAAIVQRLVGFGFALFAVPLLTFVLPAKSAVIVVILDGAIVSSWLAVRLRREIDWPMTRRLGAGAVIGAPIGVAILSVVTPTTLRVVLGVTTSAAAVWIIVSSRVLGTEVVRPRPARTLALGVASGAINTALATNGPPLVYELRRSGFRDDRFRATISAVFVISNLIGLPLLALAGLVTAFDLAVAASSLLPCVAGVALGARLTGRLDPAHFVWAVDLLLLATGVVTVLRGLS